MNSKQKLVVEYLLKTRDWTTSSTIANHIGTSVRTVKSYISDLNIETPGIIAASQNGYMINSNLALSVLNNENRNDTIPQTNKERTFYLITKLLRDDNPIDIYDFCNEIFISLSTFKIILKIIKDRLDPYDLSIVNNNDQIRIVGDEVQKRKILIDYIFMESNSTYFDISTIQAVFTNIDTDFTINTLKEVLWENRYFISDLTITSIVLHIIVAIDRNIHNPNSSLNRNLKPQEYIPKELSNLMFQIVTRLEDYYDVKFSEDDVLEFTMLFYSRTYSLDTNAMDDETLQKYLGSETIDIINELFHELKDNYNIEITNKESRIFFCIHIRNLLVRSKTQNFSRNPLTSSVKANAPLIYDAAVSLSHIITENTGVVLIDDEIAFIAFHIGSVMEKELSNKSRISAVLYCPTYYRMETNLKDNITERFQNDLIIDDIITGTLEKSQLKNTDLLITTVPVKGIGDIDTVNISVFMNMIDVIAIEKSINKIKSEKKKKSFIRHIRRMTDKEFFKHTSKSYTKKEILSKMCNNLIEKGYANEDFLEDVLKREKLSSTQYENFAIPHTVKIRQKKSCIYICISEDPINWNGNEVNLIALLCLAPEDKDYFFSLFETLSLLLMNKDFIQKLLEAKTYDELMEVFETCNTYLNNM